MDLCKEQIFNEIMRSLVVVNVIRHYIKRTCNWLAKLQRLVIAVGAFLGQVERDTYKKMIPMVPGQFLETA